MKCKVCGRSKEEIETEFGNPVEIKTHQGIKKCSKCIREYTVETDTGEEDSSESLEGKDWKERVTV